MFSVVIPLYNKEQTVERAIRSVLKQIVQEFEIIVVDDGSTDSGPHVVEATQDARIRLIHQENQGVSAARNRGVAEARFAWVAFLDADDEWKPTFLETVRCLANRFPEASVLATSYVFCGEEGRVWYPVIRGLPRASWQGILTDYFAVAARSDPPVWSSAVAVKREALLAVGGFPVGITSGEDLLTWAKLAVRCKVAFSTAPAVIFHNPPRHPSERPGRCFDYANDVVGEQLVSLVEYGKTLEERISLRQYVARWYTMRASIAFRCQPGRAVWGSVKQAVRYGGVSTKLAFFAITAVLPLRLRQQLFDCCRRMRHALGAVALPGAGR